MSYSSWPIPVAQVLPGNTGDKALRPRLFHCLMKTRSTAWILSSDLMFEWDVNHKFMKYPNHCDLDNWPNSSVWDCQVQSCSFRLTLWPSPAATGSILPPRGAHQLWLWGAKDLWEKTWRASLGKGTALSHYLSRATDCMFWFAWDHLSLRLLSWHYNE